MTTARDYALKLSVSISPEPEPNDLAYARLIATRLALS